MTSLEHKIPPGALLIAAAAAMWAMARALPPLTLAIPWHHGLALVCAIGGVGFILAGGYEFRRAHTTVDPTRPQAASAIVTDGVYRISRNPMYVGFALLLLAWGLHLAHTLAFFFVPAYVAYLNRFQIEPEERALAAKFGDAYASYTRAVRRWL